MRFLLLTILVSCSFPVFANTAFVNLMEAFEKTSQGKRVRQNLEKQAKKAQKTFKSTERKLKKEEETLSKEVALLSDQARSQKIQQLQQKILNFQREAKNKDLELQNLQNKLTNPVIARLRSVSGRVAKKEGYKIVKNIGNDVLWVSPELDLTKKVYTQFNKQYK